MDQFVIQGPCQLKGTVEVSRAKNACLPLMASVLLNPHKVTLKGVPELKDISTMNDVLKQLGVIINSTGQQTEYCAENITSFEATYDLVRTMRASVLVLGPLLARFHKAKVSLPGGCAIGARPIDIHLED